MLSHYAISNESGEFEIKSIPSGKFIFQLSFLGYDGKTQLMEFSGEEKEVSLGFIQLKPNEKILKELTSREQEIQFRGRSEVVDVLQYRSGQLKQSVIHINIIA